MDAALHSRVQGSGDPVVLIHGLFGSLENLGVQARALADNFTVYSLDLPNHGRSQHVDVMTLTGMATAVEQWMQAQGLASAHFVGHSLGGKVAMELALMSPSRVQKLAVIDIAPVLYTPHHSEIFLGLQQLDLAALNTRADADTFLLPFVPELAVRSFLLKNLVKNSDGFGWRMNLDVIAKCYSHLIAANSLGTPFENNVLFLKGGDSPYIINDHKDAIAARFPAAKIRILAGTGHWLHAEKPEHTAKILNRFLSPS